MATYIFFGIVGVAAVFAARYFYSLVSGRALNQSFKLSLLSVKLPKIVRQAAAQGSEGAFRDSRSEINRFEQFLSNLSSLKHHFVLEVGVPHVGEEIMFYLAIPKKSIEIAAKQIQGIWSGASVEIVRDDYNIFNPNGSVSSAYMMQKDDFALPIRTYEELEADTFSSIIGALSKVNETGEGAALQIVAKPAFVDSKKHIEKFIENLKKGESLNSLTHKKLPLAFSEIKKVIQNKEDDKSDRIIDEEAIKMLSSKLNKPLFQVNMRLIASAPTPFQAQNILDSMISGFEQFSSPRHNNFKAVRSKNGSRVVNNFIYRSFDGGRSMILSSQEIASVYHYPISTTDTPKIKWLKSKQSPPPSNMPTDGTYIGESDFRGEKKKVYITDEDRRRHVYVVGQTGTGKTTLLGSMVINDIQRGRGVALVDPHGELLETVLEHVPKERYKDVIIFDPSDLERPLGINMLDYNQNRPEEKTFIVNEMQSIFNKLFSQETMGPMFEQYMRNALLLLMEDLPYEPATLIEVPRVFTDQEFRRRKLARIRNPVVVDFWEKEAVKAGGEASLANMTPYITSKFNNFISNDYVRPIIGQVKSAFNFREVMDSRKILLVNLSKGKIGDINAGLLGMIITGKILMAALSRVDIKNIQDRQDFCLYIDEFQNFTTDSIATILSEARKYALNLTMAHQFVAQLSENIRDAVFGNVGSQIVMRVGVQDAEFLVKQFEPYFDENDLIGIDNLNAVAKILINGQTSSPFNIRVTTRSWERGSKEFAEKMKEYSRLKYGMEAREIEAATYNRLRS